MTLVPAAVLVSLELLLRLFGYGYSTDFFLRKEIDGRQVYIENAQFSRRFFPPGLARATPPAIFPADKSPGTFRIFVLGESAAQGFPDFSFSFSRILERMLQERFPETHFEVINTAMTAINSHCIVPLARDCARCQPDLFIVYMGNNEVVGPFGASGVLGSPCGNLALLRASIGAKTTKTGQMLSALLGAISQPKETPREWDGMAMFLGSQVRAGDRRMSDVYANFARNVRDICETGRSQGACVILCTVACNLRDLPPFASLSAPNLNKSQEQQLNRLIQEGMRREKAGEPGRAAKSFQQALKIDDQRADLHFRLARCLSASERLADANEHYRSARDLDTLRFRADSAINEALRALAAAYEARAVVLVDSERAFAEAGAAGAPGDEFFFEHVHLNFSGNYLLAKCVFAKVERIVSQRTGAEAKGGMLSETECKERLAYTDLNLSKDLQGMAGLFLRPPFDNQIDSKKRNRQILQKIAELKKRLDGEGLENAKACFRRALTRAPDDYVLHMNYALALEALGDLAQATVEAREVLKYVSHNSNPHVYLAHLLAEQNEIDEALAVCAEALRLQPDHSNALKTMKILREKKGSP